jgi:arylsulfatase A-like enzyme
MDTRIGDMLRNLRADDLANTYIVFIGDNGTPWSATQGDQANFHGHTAQGKNTAYESGIRVPYIVTDGAAWAAYEACPAGKRADGTCTLPQDRIARPGRTSEAPVHTTDLFATIAELADVDASTGVDSQSILPCFFDSARTCSSPDGVSPRVLYSERFICDGAANPCAGEDLIDGTFAIRRGRYKLLGAYDQTNACIRQQMFDMATDTWEQLDVSSSHPRELAALELELLRLNPGWQADLPRCP